MAKRGRPKHPDILTPRQSEVLELVREGLTNPQIAERLGISPNGAKWHVKEILWRLDVPSREDAARWQHERDAIGLNALHDRGHWLRGNSPMMSRPERPTLRTAA